MQTDRMIEQDHHHNEPHTHSLNDPEHRYAFYAVVIFMGLLVLIVAQDAWRSHQQKVDTPVPLEKHQPKDPEANLIEARGFSSFPELSNAMIVINTSQNKLLNQPGTEMITNGVVEAEEERVVYFATAATPTNEETHSGIYQMNTVSKRWQRMYKQVFAKNLSDHFYRVIGRKGNELLLFEDNKNRTDLPCQSFWIMGQSEPYKILTLDILNPYSSLNVWAVPDGFITSEQERIKTCQK